MSKIGTYVRVLFCFVFFCMCIEDILFVSQSSHQNVLFQFTPSLHLSLTLRFSPESHVLTFAFSVTGAIQVARRIDRDAGELRQNPVISLEVLVKDRPSGAQENRKQITFTVEDINDNPSTCTKFTFRYLPPITPFRGPQLLCYRLAGTEGSGTGDMLNNISGFELSLSVRNFPSSSFFLLSLPFSFLFVSPFFISLLC